MEKKVDVQIVDAFVSKCKDVYANVGVLISRKGFSRTAVQKARRENIGLQMLQSIQDLSKDSFINEIPVWVHILSPKVHLGLRMSVEKTTTISDFKNINDFDIEKKLGEAIDTVWNNLHSLDFPSTLTELGIDPPYYLIDNAGDKINLTEDSIRLFVEENWCKGKISQIKNTKVVTDICDNKYNIICYTDDIDLREFVKVNKDDVPEGMPYLEAKEIVKDFHFFYHKIVKLGKAV